MLVWWLAILRTIIVSTILRVKQLVWGAGNREVRLDKTRGSASFEKIMSRGLTYHGGQKRHFGAGCGCPSLFNRLR